MLNSPDQARTTSNISKHVYSSLMLVHKYILNLSREETKFRWHTGRILIAGTEAATVDNFYMMHSKTSADLELYIHNLPAHLSKGNGSKNAKTRKFYLEFAINFQAVRSSTQIHSYF